MKIFTCECGNRVFFENTRCLRCGRALGFLPDQMRVAALESAGDVLFAALPDGARYRRCMNGVQHGVCNWMVPEAEPGAFCAACRLNEIIPNLGKPENLERWQSVEQAKRRLLYELYNIGLPVPGRQAGNANGLAFRFMEDPEPGLEFEDRTGNGPRILTGHAGGVITINILEADDVAREQMRRQMNEAYRTLLGHFRHESGHFYWDLLLRDQPLLEECRAVFGDERADYDSAVQAYYANGPRPDWQQHFISAYASAHPWEDWAECWAHYLHMVDGLETAWAVGMVRTAPVRQTDFDEWVRQWIELTVALNAINRSMGLRDPYPFVLTDSVIEKLRFVHRVVRGAGDAQSSAA